MGATEPTVKPPAVEAAAVGRATAQKPALKETVRSSVRLAASARAAGCAMQA